MLPAQPSEVLDPTSATSLKALGIFLYLGILVFIGFLASRRMKDIRDYYAAGKDLGFWSTAFSARATGESAWLLIGLTGLGAALGVKAFWVVLGAIFLATFSGLGGLVGGSWPYLGASWREVGLSWAILASSWDLVGSMLGQRWRR